jgi:hypothetical protein
MKLQQMKTNPPRWKAVRGSANTNENLPISFMLSELKIMYGERVGIQVLQHNTNQIKTREKQSPKPADSAEMDTLESGMLHKSRNNAGTYISL